MNQKIKYFPGKQIAFGFLGALGLTITTAQAETLYILQDVGSSQQLSTIDSAAPNTTSNTVAITGLQTNESLLGIDFRPATGELFALGNTSSIYTIDTASGVATQVGSGFTDSLHGTYFGFDFNPTIDRIRIVSDTQQNFVANPENGQANVAVTTPVFYATGDLNEGATPQVVSHAYTNAFDGATTSQLYAIDTALDILVTQANNTGVLNTVGTLGLDLIAVGGFDISGETSIAYVAGIAMGNTTSSLYTLDLTTGALTEIGTIGEGVGLIIAGIAVAPATVIPSPAALPAGLILLGFLITRRPRTLRISA